jgi:hypothetical protein
MLDRDTYEKMINEVCTEYAGNGSREQAEYAVDYVLGMARVKIEPTDRLTGKCNYEDQERPRRHCHEIKDYWCADKSCVDYVSVLERPEITFAAAKEVIRLAHTNGQWVSILYNNGTKSISGSIREVTPHSVRVGPNEVVVRYSDIERVDSFDPAGNTEPPGDGVLFITS